MTNPNISIHIRLNKKSIYKGEQGILVAEVAKKSRALNVLRFFLEKAKIPPKRLTAVGFGEFQPLFPQ